METITKYQAKYFAHELQRSYSNDHVGKLAGLLFDAQVEPKPHQIDAALFALKTPFLRGVILADEVGLGKTIEAGLVVTQYWAERKRKILIIAPSSLRQQWQQELLEKFHLPSTLVDSKGLREYQKQHHHPMLQKDGIYICSYEFVNANTDKLLSGWDLIIADEAHKLRNYWTGRAKVADSVAKVMGTANKVIMLTATPLQNKLEELYGLVSVFDNKYFHSIDAFKERYIKNREDTSYDDLSERVAQISKRTLRKTAEKYIKYTKRLPLTVEFESAPEEQKLYDLVNTYLQRDELYAFSASQRHLSALILRKRLGSSTYAVASTLENIAKRLSDELAEGKLRDNRGGLFIDDDLSSDELEEFDDAPVDRVTEINQSKTQLIQAEINELKQYASLARSIKVNQKAVKLNEALDKGFEKLREIGAPQKAIIFTDSTKTQEYIAESLKKSGYGEGLLLFNGSNNSPEANKIYTDWREKNKDSDLITGIVSADKRKALVDYFKNEGKIMIATEAAAEGINLQFCSMIVNYDLPWNPQRVEQRIGRCHRYGQLFNVVVVNFSNSGNIAEQRILELLSTKFHLFESVFGASDQVLGSIENGLDFEKQISNILSKCTTSKEIDTAFKDLEAKYATEISTELKNARAKVFDNLDPDVQDRLKAYDEQSDAVLNKFERLLLAITKFGLKDRATFSASGKVFDLLDSPVKSAPAGKYYFKSEPLENAHQYRYSSPLAQYLLEGAQNSDTPYSDLEFSIDATDRPSTAVKSLAGKSGSMHLQKVTFSMKAKHDDVSESYIVATAVTDDGQTLDAEYVSNILSLSCVNVKSTTITTDPKIFKNNIEEQLKHLETEVQTRNSKYYDQQEEIMYRSKLDQKAASESKIRDYKSKEKEARRKARSETDPLKQLEHKKEARKWEQKAEAEDDRARDERRKKSEQADEWLSLIEEALKGKRDTEELFTIRWSIT